MSNYREEKDIEYEQKFQHYASRLPEFYKRFCSKKVKKTTKATYAYNVYEFFEYLVNNNPNLRRGDSKDEWIKNITLEDLEQLTQLDATEYVETLGQKYAPTTSRAKINAISAFYLNMYRLGQIDKSPFLKIERPDISKKETIIHLAREEREAFMSVIKNGTGLTDREKKRQDVTRDLAIFTLFLDTGIRISELVGIDVSDIDFYEHSISVVRKKRKLDSVFMSDDAEDKIKAYMRERQTKLDLKKIKTTALFLSDKMERISVRRIQRLTQRYVTLANINKKISPHKLRATFAMDFIDEIPDLMLLQEAMGHENPATTEIYARASKKKQKEARNFRNL